MTNISISYLTYKKMEHRVANERWRNLVVAIAPVPVLSIVMNTQELPIG